MELFNKLISDFVKCHENNYLDIQPYIAFLNAAYCLGVEDGKRNNSHAKIVRRSDGKTYESITEAAEKNQTHKRNISKAIINKHKSAGYYWSFTPTP